MSLKDDIKPSSYLKEHSDELIKDVAEAMAMLKLLAMSEKNISDGNVVPHDEVFKKMDKIIKEAQAVEKEAAI